MPSNKKSSSKYRLYLKILGVIMSILAIITMVSGIAAICMRSQISLEELNVSDEIASVRGSMTDEQFISMAGGLLIGIGLIRLVTGWLLMRASKDPSKSTLVLVLMILQVISAAYTLFSNGFGVASTVIPNIVNLTVYVLAVLSIYGARKEIE